MDIFLMFAGWILAVLCVALFFAASGCDNTPCEDYRCELEDFQVLCWRGDGYGCYRTVEACEDIGGAVCEIR
jgi:hypothetical protein